MTQPLVRIRAFASGRPATDEACAGCAQLGTLRALRRASVEMQGGIGCDLDAERDFVAAPGRWAAVTGVARLLREGAPALLHAAARAGARILVIADRIAPVRSTSLEDALARTGKPIVRLDLDDLALAEARVRQALEVPGTVLLALSPCVRGAPREAPLVVDATLCNRCGACLSLACPAISDDGEEAVRVDAGACTGCGRCAPMCRSRALGPVG
jgi:TPP-dependent indolepyruvate ferredoxin oxidoreductase alpha subunit